MRGIAWCEKEKNIFPMKVMHVTVKSIKVALPEKKMGLIIRNVSRVSSLLMTKGPLKFLLNCFKSIIPFKISKRQADSSARKGY